MQNSKGSHSIWVESKPFHRKTLFSKLFPTYILIPRLQTSWYNTLFLEISSHSWFFFFDKNCPKHFPHWFLHWWQLHFGLDGKTFPTSAKQGFDLFMSKTQNLPYEPSLMFAHSFKIAWILAWDYFITQPGRPYHA